MIVFTVVSRSAIRKNFASIGPHRTIRYRFAGFRLGPAAAFPAFSARMIPIRANMTGPPRSATAGGHGGRGRFLTCSRNGALLSSFNG